MSKPQKSSDRGAPPRDSIGGTTAVMLRGLSKFGGPHKVFRRLHQLDPPIEQTFDMKRGIILEDPVVDRAVMNCEIEGSWFGEDRELYPSKLWGTGVIYDPEYPGIHATIDRILFDSDGKPVGIVEVKTYNSTFYKYNWEREDHPAQVAHYACIISRWLQKEGRLSPGQYLTENYLLVCQTYQNKWKSLVEDYEDKSKGHEYVVNSLTPENKVLIECRRLPTSQVDPERYEKEELVWMAEWFKKHVGDNPKSDVGPWMVLPPSDRTNDCKRNVQEHNDLVTAFGPLTESLGEAQGEALKSIQDLVKRRNRASSDQKKALERVKSHRDKVSEIDNEIKLLMSGYTYADVSGSRITIKQRAGRRNFDSARFKKDHPTLYKDYIKQGDPTDIVDIN